MCESSPPPPPPISSVKFSPNGKFLLTGTLASRLLLWECASRRVKKTYRGHISTTRTLQPAFLTNEPSVKKYVVCGSQDYHVFAWDLNSKEVVGVLRGRPTAASSDGGHCDVPLAVDCSSEAPLIASGGGDADRTIKLWRYVAPPGASGADG